MSHRNLRVDVHRVGVDGDSAIVEWTWSFHVGNRRVSDQPSRPPNKSIS